MLVVRPLAIIEDGVKGGQILRIGTEPGIDVFRPDRNGAAVMPGGGDFGGQLVGDGGE